MSGKRGKTAVKRRQKSLQFYILIPMIVTVLLVVMLMSILFSRSYVNMFLKQENEENAVGFKTVSQ